MVGVRLLTDFLLVVCAVRSKEHGSLVMVPMKRGAWFLGMKRQENYFNTNPTDYTICYDMCGDNCTSLYGTLS